MNHIKWKPLYREEFAFRWNRRKTNGVGRIAARTIGNLVAHGPLTLRTIKANATPYPHFVGVNSEVPELRTSRTIVESQSVCVGVTQAAWIPSPGEQS